MATEMGRGTDSTAIGVTAPLAEHGAWTAIFKIERYDVPVDWYVEREAKRLAMLSTLERARTNAFKFDTLPAWLRSRAKKLFEAENKPYDVSEFHNNLLPNGVQEWLNGLTGTAFTSNTGGAAAGAMATYNATQSRLAIGDSNTAFANTQTWLQAATNKYAQVVDSAPVVSIVSHVAQVVFVCTIASGNANYAWQEFCTDNGGGSNSTSTTFTGSSALNRAVSSQGTKASGQTWTLTETISIQ